MGRRLYITATKTGSIIVRAGKFDMILRKKKLTPCSQVAMRHLKLGARSSGIRLRGFNMSTTYSLRSSVRLHSCFTL